MKRKIKVFVNRMATAVRQNPVEVVLAVLFGCLGCLSYETENKGVEAVVAYAPVCFLVTYLLNALTAGGCRRAVYYLSLLLFVPFLCVQREVTIWTAHYGVTLVVVQLLYLVSGGGRGNVAFVRKGLRYLQAGISAVLLSVVAWLLILSAYYSVRYIFEIEIGSEARFHAYASSLVFLTVMPLLFLMFNQERNMEAGSGLERLFTALLNYVLSPALLMYAVILYLYLVKIAFIWSLPKGGVALIVTGFVAALFVLKGCQPFLRKRYYDWLYNHASWVALPVMVLYWVGACYRIHQYGYTEARVYLVAVGILLSGTVVLFFARRTGHYRYAAWLGIVVLSTVTYIPGFTAKDIERISQAKHGNYLPLEAAKERRNLVISSDSFSFDITGYTTFQPVTYGGLQSALERDTFYLRTKEDHLLFRMQKDSLWARQLRKIGLEPGDTIPEPYDPELLRLELDSALYIFGTISLHRPALDLAYQVTYMGEGYYLSLKTKDNP